MDPISLKNGRQLRPIKEPVIVVDLRLVGDNKKECLIKKADGRLEWVAHERIKPDDILAYYKSLMPESNAGAISRQQLLFNRFAAVEDVQRDALLKQFLTPSGLEIPDSQRGEINKRLKELKSEFDPIRDKAYAANMAQLRQLVVTETIIEARQAQQQQLAEQLEHTLAEVAECNAKFRLENKVDLETLDEFYFTEQLHPMPGVDLDAFADGEGCSCDDGCQTAASCACIRATEPYYQAGKLRPKVQLVYECTSKCRCVQSASCHNSVVANGCPYSLVLFKTFNGCGWGIRTSRKIEEGSYVLTYTGDIITDEEKQNRDSIWLFDLYSRADKSYATATAALDGAERANCTPQEDGHDSAAPQNDHLFIDALYKGNLSRFVNHSCDPNLDVVKVFTDCLGKRIPKITFFANRKIQAGEELCIDYGSEYKLDQCRCGRRKCFHASSKRKY